MNADEMKTILDGLTPQERVQLVEMAKGEFVTAVIMESGNVQLVGHGNEYAPDCDMFSCIVDGDVVASNRALWENALDESAPYVYMKTHGDDFDAISEILSADGYDWRECVARMIARKGKI